MELECLGVSTCCQHLGTFGGHLFAAGGAGRGGGAAGLGGGGGADLAIAGGGGAGRITGAAILGGGGDAGRGGGRAASCGGGAAGRGGGAECSTLDLTSILGGGGVAGLSSLAAGRGGGCDETAGPRLSRVSGIAAGRVCPAGDPGGMASGFALFPILDSAGAGADGASLAFGFAAGPAAAGGTGGTPLAPGMGSVLAFGNPCPCGNAFGVTLAGTAPGVPGLAVGLIDALGGTGNLPCWIREARCATAGGRDGPGAPARDAAAAVGEADVAAG